MRVQSLGGILKVAFVTLASEDYFPGAKRLVESVKQKTRGHEYEFLLLTDCNQASEYFGELFSQIEQVPLHQVNLAASSKVPRFIFTQYKMYVLEILRSHDFDRIIFLDSDLLCLSTLAFLLDQELNACDFLAVRDHASMKYYSSEITEIGLDVDEIFNSGMFIINRSFLRKLDYISLVEMVSDGLKSYDGGDQGYWNYAIQNSSVSFRHLPLRFNYPLDVNYPFKLFPPALVHFTGEKPWFNPGIIPVWDNSLYKFWNLPNLEIVQKSFYRKLLFRNGSVPWLARVASLIWHYHLVGMIVAAKYRLRNGRANPS